MAQRRQSGLDAAAAQLGGLLVRLVVFVVAIGGSALFLAATLSPLAAVASAAINTVNDVVLNFDPLPESFGLPDERSVVLDRNGVELAILRDVNRKIVTIDEVPEHVQNAIIATEDQEFRNHEGVNWQAIGRAAVGNISAGEVVGGASTITQQLVKNLVVGDEVTFDRKLREAVLAMQLEDRLSKDEILERYLNEAYFANRVYGIGTAAEFYFNKDIGELTADEAAMLAGILRAPQINEPIDHPDAAFQRRNIVLGQMVDQGYLTPDEGYRLQQRPLSLDITPISEPENPFFIDYVRYILLNEEEALGATLEDRQRSLFRGGLTVTTTLDVRLADIADEAIREVLEAVDGPQSALTAVDPKTGEILAIGFGPRAYGKGPGESQVNPAVPYLGDIFGQQTGSSFKAFEIVAALESGVSPAYTTDTPSPYRPTGFCPKNWTPGNYSDGGGGFMDMTRATTFSSNVYFAHLIDEFTGPEKLAEVAERMGVVNTAWEPLAKFNCSNVLGAAGSYPVDMAAGFGTMANNGAHCETHAILEIRDREDRVIARHDPKCKQVIEAGIAARATDLLRGPIDSGTAARNGKIGRPAAGKTGTTQDYHDAWFIGFIPQLSAATWVGHVEGDIEMRDPRCGRSGAVTGGCLPTMIWQRFMTRSIELLELPVEEFPTPPPIPRSTVPAVVGLPIEEAEDIVGEADFVPEAETLPHWAPAGIVFEQNPEAGTSIGGGSKVLLSVSDGTAEPPVVPNLIGMKEPEAVALLDELGYVPKVTLWPVSKPAEYGIVIDQDPVAGTAPELDLYTDPAGLVLGQVEIFVGRPRTADDPPETATARTPGASATAPAKTGNRD